MLFMTTIKHIIENLRLDFSYYFALKPRLK